jgi:hypothetical protein
MLAGLLLGLQVMGGWKGRPADPSACRTKVRTSATNSALHSSIIE